jgi:hypothetical protein
MARTHFLGVSWAIALLGLAAPSGAQVELDWKARYAGYGDCPLGAGTADIAIDAWGNVLVAAHVCDAEYDWAFATIKYGPDGSRQWARRFDGSTHYRDLPRCLGVDAAGNVYVAGETFGRITDWDAVVLAYDPAGNLRWKRIFDRGLEDAIVDMVVDSSGNVYLTGRSEAQATGMDILTLAYDVSGNLLWERRFDGPGSGEDFGRALALDRSGRLIVTGLATVAGSGSAYATICYDLAGTELWSRLYDPSVGRDGANDVAVDGQGRVIVIGSVEEPAGSGHYRNATVSYDPLGNLRWARRHGASVTIFLAGRIAADPGGEVVVVGAGWVIAGPALSRDWVTLCYDAQGNQIWSERFGGASSLSDDAPQAIAIDPWGRAVVSGQVQPDYDVPVQCTTVAYRPTCSASIQVYCTAKPSSQGCAPRIALLDAPSATKGNGSTLQARDLIAGQVGLFLHGTSGAASTPFHGGFLCLSGPWMRHPPRSTGGSGTACAGALEEDLNAYIAAGVDPRLVAGATVYVQAWARDPGDPTLDSLSDAVSALICP